MRCRPIRCQQPARRPGVYVGIVRYATLSDGTGVNNPRWGRTAADKLAVAQQRLQRAKRGSANRGRKRETVSALHRKIAHQPKDFHHTQARKLVEEYDLLVVEDLQIANMVPRAKPVAAPDHPGQYLANRARAKSGFSRSISDAGWGQFVSILRAKAEDAGRIWIEVDPATPPTAARNGDTQPQQTASRKRNSSAKTAGAPPGRRTRRTQHLAGWTGASHPSGVKRSRRLEVIVDST
jgi:transposase